MNKLCNMLPVKRNKHGLAYEVIYEYGNAEIHFYVLVSARDKKGVLRDSRFTTAQVLDRRGIQIPDRVYKEMSHQARGILFDKRGGGEAGKLKN